MKKLLLIMNPYSGQKVGKRHLADVLEMFCREGYAPLTFMTTGPGNATELARTYGGQVDLVVCMGGDGTFNEVVSGMLEGKVDTPIGYIPCGSTNDFANSLKLQKNLRKAAQDILEGVPVTLDVGQFGQRYFSYVASFGAFTRASYATPQNVKNALGHLAYILEGIKDIANIRPYRLRIETEKEVFEGEYLFGAISNATSVGGILTLNPAAVDMNDGLLELLLIKPPKNPIELNDCIRSLQEQTYDSPMLTFSSVAQMRIYADPGMDWTLDGEYERGREDVTVRNVHNAIHLLLRPREGKT